ncbi:NAD(P)-dependent oxidoreductase [Dyadobacter sp. CY323]|uniref:NAD(P)-dependent oxidoreductase n=1 Tax=Dyadobacter sp. CY323 TaxID=2907302 RepID=UPI001F335954|nr:NAD(P)-dependent oxidoreductase [Dyadobacter sp. CY323]MCE6991136.1 D-2-hydroxyacid dehydrogenase [Dyadobacter sp. CY323]
MKIFIYADLQKHYLEELVKQLSGDAEMILKEQLSDDEIMQEIKSADILIGNPPSDLFNDIPDTLKFWQLENVGFEQYKDLHYKGVAANVGDMSAAACAETIVAGILGFYRGVHIMVRNQLNAEWQGEAVESHLSVLGEKQVIILGSGSIGEHVSKMLEAFGCSVQMTAKSDPAADIHSYDELLSQLPETDLVINTLPGNLDKYVAKDFFDSMKEGALYASIGRGNTTDENALINALESGKLAGAVLDVTETEPLPKDSKLWKMTNAILTQHTGAAHKMRDRDKVAKFVDNVRKFLNGEKIKDEIELANGY